jgi:hypothetical protein
MTNTPKDVSLVRFVGHPPAGLEDIERTQRQLHFRLPNSYVEFLLSRDGGEGFIGGSYLVLWRIEDLIAMNKAYNTATFAPDLLLIGSDGGGEAFGFDTRTKSLPIVSVPFVPMDVVDAKAIAPDFGAFLSALAGS